MRSCCDREIIAFPSFDICAIRELLYTINGEDTLVIACPFAHAQSIEADRANFIKLSCYLNSRGRSSHTTITALNAIVARWSIRTHYPRKNAIVDPCYRNLTIFEIIDFNGINGRIRRGTPAQPTNNNIQAAIVSHCATTGGCFPLNVCNLSCCHSWNAISGGEGLLFSVHRSTWRNSVGADIIGGAPVQPCHGCGKTAYATTLFNERVLVGRRVLMRGPAKAFHEDVGTICSSHLAAAHSGIAGNQHRL